MAAPRRCPATTGLVAVPRRLLPALALALASSPSATAKFGDHPFPKHASEPSHAKDPSSVKVVFLTEAGCPYCQKAIAGAVNDMIRRVGDVVDMVHLPFGNTYFATKECGHGPEYDRTERLCWDQMCLGVPTPPADCFQGDLVFQHGAKEGQVDRLLSCASGHSGSWRKYWPFAVCMNREYADSGPDAAHKCAQEAGLDASVLDSCYGSSEADALIVQEAKATPNHDGTPTVLVNGKLVNTDEVLQAVCAAYAGKRPAGCDGVVGGQEKFI